MANPEFDVTREAAWKPSELPVGFVIPDGGNSVLYNTGSWRSQRPVWDADACNNCLLCWVYCPDVSIKVENQKMVGIDLDHCKGCGICVKECKFGALKIVTESEAKEAENE